MIDPIASRGAPVATGTARVTGSMPPLDADADQKLRDSARQLEGLFVQPDAKAVVFSQWTWGGLEPFTLTLAPFIHVGEFISNWSIRLDGLSAVMLVVVTTVSALVHVYSWGYMAEDPSRPRFFAYLSLFTFAMLALVTAALPAMCAPRRRREPGLAGSLAAACGDPSDGVTGALRL